MIISSVMSKNASLSGDNAASKNYLENSSGGPSGNKLRSVKFFTIFETSFSSLYSDSSSDSSLSRSVVYKSESLCKKSSSVLQISLGFLYPESWLGSKYDLNGSY